MLERMGSTLTGSIQMAALLNLTTTIPSAISNNMWSWPSDPVDNNLGDAQTVTLLTSLTASSYLLQRYKITILTLYKLITKTC